MPKQRGEKKNEYSLIDNLQNDGLPVRTLSACESNAQVAVLQSTHIDGGDHAGICGRVTGQTVSAIAIGIVEVWTIVPRAFTSSATLGKRVSGSEVAGADQQRGVDEDDEKGGEFHGLSVRGGQMEF